MGRVDGQLALSRAFGDRMLKQPVDWKNELRKVTSKPDFIENTATKDDFLFLACDGIYEGDFFTRESVIQWIREKMATTNDLADICCKLLDECLNRGSKDNMSAMLVQFIDGSDYEQEKNEYIPGPWFIGDRDNKFQEAYVSDAKAAGYELTDALALRKEIEQKEKSTTTL